MARHPLKEKATTDCDFRDMKKNILIISDDTARRDALAALPELEGYGVVCGARPGTSLYSGEQNP